MEAENVCANVSRFLFEVFMKEQIYTIPVMDAFREECECPMCLMERKVEGEYIEYILGASLMEPDCRIETNDKGFCRRHFELLYNRQENRLGLGLMIDTHLCEQNKKLEKIFKSRVSSIEKDARVSLKQTETEKLVNKLVSELKNLQSKCTICSKLDYTMDRYIDVIFHLWSKEEEFRKLFNSKKGFCLKHLEQLLDATKKYLSPKEAAIFVNNLLCMQLCNMDRIQKDVNWFTKKFDYRYNDAPWGDSKDALLRSIQKLAGFCELK